MTLRAQTLRKIPERFEALLASTSELIGARVELVLTDGRPAVTQPPLPICIACGNTRDEKSANCQALRHQTPLRSAAGNGRGHWFCPHHCEVFTQAIWIPQGQVGTLIAVRPASSGPAAGRGEQETGRFLEHLASLFSEHLALSSELMSVNGELHHRCEELNLLHTISGRLTGEEDMRRGVQEILGQARRTLRADVAILAINHQKMFHYDLAEGPGDNTMDAARVWRRVGGLVSDHLQNDGRSYYSGSFTDLGLSSAGSGRATEVLGVAVRIREEFEGSLAIVYLESEIGRPKEKIRLLDSVSERVGVVLANLELYENLKDFLMATVKSLVSAIDAKDRYTSGHSERVNILSMLIGKTMGLGAEDLEVLRWASILHDVGKIGMPESILKKPGRLTPEEFEIVKEHPERGYRVLAPIRQLSAASMGVRCHHEMVDGGGYPLGLRADEIPLTARIISVADTYDALTTNRSYRLLTTPDHAFDAIQKVRNKQLDAEVIDVLGTLMPFIREHQVMLQPVAGDAYYGVPDETDREAA